METFNESNFSPYYKFQILLLLFVWSLSVKTQNATQSYNAGDQLTPKSPQAEMLFKFHDIPVSEYTGLPSINIPVYTINSGNLTANISLDYHSSGHYIGAYANWCGQGWKLGGGGMISRRIGGFADEDAGGFIETVDQFTGSGSYDPYGNCVNAFSQEIYTHQQGQQFLHESITEQCLDSEPDEFIFSVNGLTGSFIYDWTGTFKVTCNQHVSILQTPFDGSGNAFILVGPDGTQYTFGSAEWTAVDKGYDSHASCFPYVYTYRSSWVLTEMKDINGAQLFFDYTPFTVLQKNETDFIRISRSFDVEACGTTNPTTSRNTSWTTINSLQLSSIRTHDGIEVVDFNANTLRTDVGSNSMKRLDDIRIFVNNRELKRFVLNYRNHGRLSLNSIDERNANNETKNQYAFSYHNGVLPTDINSKSIDHWGYYNNNGANKLTPSHHYKILGADRWVYFPGADREPNLQYTKADVLRSITYPTGAKSFFEYEANTYGYINDRVVNEPTIIQEEYLAKAFYDPNGTGSYNIPQTFSINSDTTLVRLDIVGWTRAEYVDFIFPSVSLKDSTGQTIKYFEIGHDSTPHDAYPQTTQSTEYITLDKGTYTLFVNAPWADDYIQAQIIYDHPDYSQMIQEKDGPGLRLSSTYQIEGADTIGYKSFHYKNASGKSTGVIYDEPQYVYEDWRLLGYLNETTNERRVVECPSIAVQGNSKAVVN
ncbi:MAG: hypothetical protein MRY83_21355, partial [Flavobacteriales bacterium]|nr:hypothetical protein [Flavobacteriales bacterium]